jgi:hypothetical protein
LCVVGLELPAPVGVAKLGALKANATAMVQSKINNFLILITTSS